MATSAPPLTPSRPFNQDHEMGEVVDLSDDRSQRFNFYVQCKTCGFEARSMTREEIDGLVDYHLNRVNTLRKQL